MKPIAILILGMGLLGSAIVQAQEAGQGSAVPRQPVLVAQAGTFTSPGSPVVAAPVAAPALTPALAVLGLTTAGLAAAGSNAGGTTQH